MEKLNEFVKETGSTMFFPRVILTYDEMERVWAAGQIIPSWLKMVVSNYDAFEDIITRKRLGTRAELYKQLVETWSQSPDIIIMDVKAFGCGHLDLIDFAIKYGVSWKKCRNFVKDVLFAASVDFDVDKCWKQHKKYVQKQTTISLYGVSHTALRPEVQEKRIKTNRKKYGADNPMQVPEIKEKLKTRIRAEHGVDYTFQKRSVIPAWQKKLFQCLTSDTQWVNILSDICLAANIPFQSSMFESVLPIARRDFVISELHNTHVEDLIRLWNQKTNSIMKFPENALFRLPFAFSKTWLKYYDDLGLLDVPDCYYRTGSSIYERNIENFLDDLQVSYLRNHKKTLHGLEMDFYIPDKGIGIEVNPNVSHNSNLYALTPTRSMFDSHKEPSYHYAKYKTAQKADITLIQLFASDLAPSVFEHITSKRLKSLLCGYDDVHYARQVSVRELCSEQERKQARDFMTLYHSQGCSRAVSYWVFERNGNWLGVASFSPHKEPGAVELKRLCFKPGVQVVGGLSKLITHYFRSYLDCVSIYSYSDNSLGNGDSYGRAGAVFVKETGPALKFISPKDGHDSYSWQIATSWGADRGVIGQDAERKGLEKPQTQDDINAYIELNLSHRSDEYEGYDRIYTPGSKLWKFNRRE